MHPSLKTVEQIAPELAGARHSLQITVGGRHQAEVAVHLVHFANRAEATQLHPTIRSRRAKHADDRWRYGGYRQGYTSSIIGLISETYDEACEREAIMIEREVDDMKIAEFMEKQIGEEFEGIISPSIVIVGNKRSHFPRFFLKHYRGGEYDYLLNSNRQMDLLHKRFIVFELDNISENRTLLPVVTIIIMETFLAKMRRLQGVRKVLLLEEARMARPS